MLKKQSETKSTTMALDAITREAASILNLRERIRTSIAQTDDEIPKAEAAAQSALEALAIEQASIALDDGHTDDPAASNGVTSANTHLQALRARVLGLRARLTATDDELTQVSGQFEEARAEWIEQRIAEYQPRYVSAAQEFANIIREGLAIASALRVTLPGLLTIKRLPSLRELNPVADFDQREAVDGTTFGVSPWRDDPAAADVYTSLAPPAALATRLTAELAPVLKHREEVAAAEAREAAKQLPRTTTGKADQYESTIAKHPRPPVYRYVDGRLAPSPTPFVPIQR